MGTGWKNTPLTFRKPISSSAQISISWKPPSGSAAASVSVTEAVAESPLLAGACVAAVPAESTLAGALVLPQAHSARAMTSAMISARVFFILVSPFFDI